MRFFVHRFLILTGVLLLAYLLFAKKDATASGPPTLSIYAAASLKNLIDNTIEQLQFKENTPDIIVVYASSGTLARQIANGAPADLFVSANVKWVNWIQNELALGKAPVIFAKNRLVIAESKTYPVSNGGTFRIHDLKTYLGSGRLAMGDPRHVPAGAYGKAALVHATIWDSIKSKLAYTRDVRTAGFLLDRGEVPLAILYKSDLVALKNLRAFFVFSENSHPPIEYAMLPLNRQISDFRWFLDVMTPTLEPHGFEKP